MAVQSLVFSVQLQYIQDLMRIFTRGNYAYYKWIIRLSSVIINFCSSYLRDIVEFFFFLNGVHKFLPERLFITARTHQKLTISAVSVISDFLRQADDKCDLSDKW